MKYSASVALYFSTPINIMFGSFLANLWSSCNQSVRSREPTLLCNQVRTNSTPVISGLRRMIAARRSFSNYSFCGYYHAMLRSQVNPGRTECHSPARSVGKPC